MPWFNFIAINFRAMLIALCPAVSIGIFLHPFIKFSIASIGDIHLWRNSIKIIHCQTKLMFTLSWLCTESSIITTPQVPKSLLIFCTPKTRNCDKWLTKMLRKFLSHRIHRRFCNSANIAISSCLIEVSPTHKHEVIRLILSCGQWLGSAYKSQNTCIISPYGIRKNRLFH